MALDEVSYLVFDIESVADIELVARLRHPKEDVDPQTALALYRKELMEEKGSDFIPYTQQLPISLALAKISPRYELIDLRVLTGSPKEICQNFWTGWSIYKEPTLVTYNGRTFDIPLLELTAFRYGISVPKWFSWGAAAYDQPRKRFNYKYHLDLYDYWSNGGAVAFYGGLNAASKILKKPGKIETHGDMVQDMYDAGRISEIHQYCRCDVLDTYFVFLRTLVVIGRISFEREQELIAQTKVWLQNKVAEEPVYQIYLDCWDHLENGVYGQFSSSTDKSTFVSTGSNGEDSVTGEAFESTDLQDSEVSVSE